LAAVREVFDVAPLELLTAVARPLQGLQAPDGSPMADRVRAIVDAAGSSFLQAARPRGLWLEVSAADFAVIFDGDGGNDAGTPLAAVLEEARSLALFAVTVGEEVSERIARLFDKGELAEGYLLDQVASFAADEMAQEAARRFARENDAGAAEGALPYSPGYCGWNVSGQRALFVRLEPTEIGVTLNESCLMRPIKSVSGVLVLAPLEAHDFSPGFPCCASCTTLDCQERVAALRTRLAPAGDSEF
jgi:hypothetical protein